MIRRFLAGAFIALVLGGPVAAGLFGIELSAHCLLYTSDAADE
mgnify:CR=1 FL=1